MRFPNDKSTGTQPDFGIVPVKMDTPNPTAHEHGTTTTSSGFCIQRTSSCGPAGKVRCRTNGWARLTMALALIVLVWLVVLPALATFRPVRHWIDRNHDRRIDPSAMFYSELEIIEPIVREVDRARSTHPDAFWTTNVVEPD